MWLSSSCVSRTPILIYRSPSTGILGAVVAIANSLGPLLGGALTASTSWRWCFIIAVPITLVAGLAVILLLPLKRVTGDTKSKLKKIDYLGASLVLAGTILVLLALNWGGNQYAWDSSQVLPTLIIGVATLVAFCLVEWKLVPLPIIPMRLFRNRTVSAVMVQTTCSGAIQVRHLRNDPCTSSKIDTDITSPFRANAVSPSVLCSAVLASH